MCLWWALNDIELVADISVVSVVTESMYLPSPYCCGQFLLSLSLYLPLSLSLYLSLFPPLPFSCMWSRPPAMPNIAAIVDSTARFYQFQPMSSWGTAPVSFVYADYCLPQLPLNCLGFEIPSCDMRYHVAAGTIHMPPAWGGKC